MIELLSIALALLIGILLVQAGDPVAGLGPRWAAVVFRGALGCGAGIGITSLLFLFLDMAGAATPPAIFGLDGILLIAVSVLWLRKRAARLETEAAPTAGPGFRWTWLLALSFGIVLILVAGRLAQMAVALPVGRWDAWAIWNLRAKFLAGPADSWRLAVSPLLAGTHPEYPLLLSSFIARAWRAAGGISPVAPIATAAVFFGATIALLMSAVALLRGVASALLAGLVMLSTTSLLVWAMAQYADIPAAFYYLGAIALILVDASPAAGQRWTLCWAGLYASLAAWTKNEGVAFLVWVPLAFLAVTGWRQGIRAAVARSRWLLAGVAPGVSLSLWFKLFLAPSADSLVTQGHAGMARLLDVGRGAQVAWSFVIEAANLNPGVGHPLILMAILTIVLRWQVEERYQRPLLIAAVVLGLMLLSYCGTILITAPDLEWELGTAAGRLLLQIWPSLLLVFFMLLRRAGDTPQTAVPVETSGRRKMPVRAERR